MGGPPAESSNLVPSTQQRAIVANKNGNFFVWDSTICPPLPPDQVLYRTEAVAINPSDTKMVRSFQTPYCILGSDFAGTVIAVGSDVRNFAVGDRVCGAMHGMCKLHPERGAFVEYNATISPTWLKVPAWMDTTAAAALCTSLATAGLALRALGVPLPDAPTDMPFPVLVYGGSTATGTILIQLLKLANLVPIATCSPRSAEMVKGYGAAEVFDYRQVGCAEAIRTYTKNKLRFALDCITTEDSTEACHSAIGRAGGRYVSLDPFLEHAAKRKAVKSDFIVGPAIFGHDITWPAPWARPAAPELLEFGKYFFAMVQKLIDAGKIRNHPIHVMEGDLGTILEGVEVVKSGAASGKKVVVALRSS